MLLKCVSFSLETSEVHCFPNGLISNEDFVKDTLRCDFFSMNLNFALFPPFGSLSSLFSRSQVSRAEHLFYAGCV